MINRILKFDEKCNFDVGEISGINDVTFRVFIVYLVICLICTLNMIYVYTSVGILHKFYVLQSVVYELQLIFGGLIQIFITSLMLLLKKRLIYINEEIEKSLNLHEIHYLKKLLEDRSEILSLCEVNLSSLFGIPLMFIFGCAVLHGASGPYYAVYMLGVNTSSKLKDFLYIIINIGILSMVQYMLFPCLIFVQDLTEEANKTARILSRISRRGTDIEKMVDKFLMKNLQQRPILTAYGFFPLNKRTLFKIFAAIFTYMVILIQFKDMENTNKKLVGTKTTTL
ncbi:gustatory and pheromone receptor 39a-like isoform X3 [Eupeodes corollae]|uniref:gustatory and pheromone receptor 39a-like isoform X3 n=1 Tax=Eupeodes corollae TaxID=290404 RepID=UPI002491D946|nr:gustatory and pheromone receptor 39a-like isoform X3 [Eupeodes corollae]